MLTLCSVSHSWLTLCNPVDCSLPDSSVEGILQARILEQVAILSRKWKWKGNCSAVFDCCDPPWTVAHKAPPSMEFSRQEYWSGLPFPSPGDLPDPGILSRGSSQTRDQTHLCISCIGRQIFFTTSTTCVRVYVRTTYINYILNADYPILESTFVMTTVCPWKVM